MTFVSEAAPGAPFDLTERQLRILELIRTSGYATLESLAEKFDVSTQTVRRDVIQLHKAGLLQRFHGGAGLPGERVRLGYREKQALAGAAKSRIAACAARLVSAGASVYLDVGTTADALARALAGRAPRVVYTNNLSAAVILAAMPEVETYVTGGFVRGGDGSLTGDQATRLLASVSVDFAFVACSGFARDGSPMDFDPHKIAVKRAAMENARHAVLIADARKFERSADMKIAPASAFRTLVTDRSPPPDLADLLGEAGTALLLADEGAQD